jgi:hypothetical protein
MHTLYDQHTRREIIQRLERLKADATPEWGKMDVTGMLTHCSLGLQMARGLIRPRRTLMGRLLGPFFRKQYSNEQPFGKNAPTADELIPTDTLAFQEARNQLTMHIIAFQKDGPGACTDHPHPFFGPLTAEEWGMGMYKHLDHHLRQFGV